MKNIISKMQLFCNNVYYSKCDSEAKTVILCVMPGLTLGGSQTVMVELLELLIKRTGYDFFILSPDDGEYRDIFTDMGCAVGILPQIPENPDFRFILQNLFHSVILNSFLTHPYLLFFVNTKTPVFWWIHEPLEHIIQCCRTMPDPKLLSPNINIYGVSDSVNEAFVRLYNCHIGTMHFAIQDIHHNYIKKNSNDCITFLMPAAYTDTKGQDILLKAIAYLPEDLRKKCIFQFCGYKVPEAEDYYKKIIEMSKHFNCIYHLGQLSRSELYQLYTECDCVVAPSRADNGPTTIIEGMMFHKLVLVSDKTGVSKYITDCVDGFVFHNEDDLLKRILLIISDIDSLQSIAERGNLIWRQHYAPESILDTLFASDVF